MNVLNDEDFEAALEALDADMLSEGDDLVAGQAVSIVRDVDVSHDHEADVVYGTVTIYLTRLATGATYENVGDIESSYGRWVDTNFSGWERT